MVNSVKLLRIPLRHLVSQAQGPSVLPEQQGDSEWHQLSPCVLLNAMPKGLISRLGYKGRNIQPVWGPSEGPTELRVLSEVWGITSSNPSDSNRHSLIPEGSRPRGGIQGPRAQILLARPMLGSGAEKMLCVL